jgi:hypothetical protein
MAYTKIMTAEGKELNFITQQYEVGLYVIVNNNSSAQFDVSDSERDFHKKLQKKAKKNGDTILESSFIFN